MKRSLGARSTIYPAPVFVVGTYDQSGKPNVMTAAWAGICCSNPPCVAISLRPATYTYGNIVKREAFTISIPSETYIKETDFFGISSGKEVDKFAATGLTSVGSDIVDAPYVEEFPFVLECRLRHTIEIGLHTQFIGEIMDIKAEEFVIGEKGLPDIEKIKPMIFAPDRRTYYGVGKYLKRAFYIGKEI